MVSMRAKHGVEASGNFGVLPASCRQKKLGSADPSLCEESLVARLGLGTPDPNKTASSPFRGREKLVPWPQSKFINIEHL
jgi:hypothetical protein